MKTVTAEDIKQHWLDEANALTREKRQEFLDLLWSGLTIGEARTRAGISFDAAIGIVNLNLIRREAYCLRTETV